MNRPYDNFFLENEIKDQYATHIDLVPFCTVDSDLVGEPGMIIKKHVYSATDSVEKVTKGVGNTGTSEASYDEAQVEIQTAQGRFSWFDEDEMTDPIVVLTGNRHLGTDIFNTQMKDIYGAFKKAVQVIGTTGFNFNAIVDAQTMFGFEAGELENARLFAFINPADVAEVRKNLGDNLKYVEAFVRRGYVGTVGSCDIIADKLADRGTMIMATKEAVRLSNKEGLTTEDERDANTRKNTKYARKYYCAWLENQTKAVKIIKGATFALTEDEAINPDKTYYVAYELGYVKVAEPEVTDIGSYYEMTVA